MITAHPKTEQPLRPNGKDTSVPLWLSFSLVVTLSLLKNLILEMVSLTVNCACMCVCVCVCVCICVCIFMCVCLCVCLCVFMYACTS